MLTTILSMGLGAVSIIAVDKGYDKIREYINDKELEEFEEGSKEEDA